MRSVPLVVGGAYRMAMRIALQELVTGRDQNSEVRVSRGSKLFTLLPRFLFAPSPYRRVGAEKTVGRTISPLPARRMGRALGKKFIN